MLAGWINVRIIGHFTLKSIIINLLVWMSDESISIFTLERLMICGMLFQKAVVLLISIITCMFIVIFHVLSLLCFSPNFHFSHIKNKKDSSYLKMSKVLYHIKWSQYLFFNQAELFLSLTKGELKKKKSNTPCKSSMPYYLVAHDPYRVCKKDTDTDIWCIFEPTRWFPKKLLAKVV